MENTPRIQRELKHIYYLSKVVCLAPFSFSWNPVSYEVCINPSLRSNITGFVWTVFMSVTMGIGLAGGIVRYKNSERYNPGVAMNTSFCFPMNFINALLSFVVLFINRFKYVEFIKTMIKIDDALMPYSTKYQNYFLYSVFTVCALLSVFMCYDVLGMEERKYFLYCSLYRIAYFISMVLIIQFCHIVRCIQQRLIILGKELSSILENKILMNVTSTAKLTPVETVNNAELSSVESQISKAENPMDISENKCSSVSSNSLSCRKLHKIVTLRQIYDHIYDATQLINSTYGFLILLLFLRAAAGLVTNIYHLTSITTKSEHVTPKYENWGSPEHLGSLVTWIMIFLGTVIWMTVTCQMTMLESMRIGDIIQKLLLQQPFRHDMLQQLKLFSDQIAKNQIEFSAVWLFKVDVSVLCTILTSVTAYIIVLLQFQ